MSIRCQYLCILLCLVPLAGLNGQMVSLHPTIEGRVLDDSTRNPLPYVHIYNESKRTGKISDKEGQFSMRADIGDTLVISALGYLSRIHMVGDLSYDKVLEIHLIPRLYEIAAVKVKGFRDYADFQRQFVALDLPKTQTRVLREQLFALSHENLDAALEEERTRTALSPEPGKPMAGGVSIPILYREDKLRINYARVLEQEKRQAVIDKKYNREIIFKVTHLSDEEITDFMGFCNFSQDYLYHATEYEILVMIEKKFKAYLHMKSRGALFRPNLLDGFLFT